MIRISFFYLLLLTVVALSWWRGGRDERIAAGICVAGAILTMVASRAMEYRFASFDLPAFLVDCAVLASLLLLALRSDRFWPLWVSGLQLTATTVHLLKLIQPDLMRFVVGAALAFWSYPILILIGIGALRRSTIERWRSDAKIA